MFSDIWLIWNINVLKLTQIIWLCSQMNTIKKNGQNPYGQFLKIGIPDFDSREWSVKGG